MTRAFQVIVIGGGHAGVEAAWAAANLLGGVGTVALVTLDPSKIGVMSCNPAIGGLAKGQIVREVDALGGLMGLATDATGIQFRMLNSSKGAAVRGPRAQCDKHAYAAEVQRLIASRAEIEVVAGSVERLVVNGGVVRGVEIHSAKCKAQSANGEQVQGDPFARSALRFVLSSSCIVLTTGTFMRGLMHTGQTQTPGGRFGEDAAVGISGALRGLGFELGRLKTGTPPRLKRSSIDWDSLEEQRGDEPPVPFSDLTDLSTFPRLPQVDCRITATCAATHEVIRANLHRAPMYSGQIQSAGPRYCPSLEDKIVRFADRTSHHVYLEPESLQDEHREWIYCNGISTSLPADVQDVIVRNLPGCERAEILRYGYAVEYDMVRPHQLWATGETKLVRGLFLAGQINGTSGYEEAAAQGVIAGINAARRSLGQESVTLGREQAYIGVLMDDLVTKTPVEPYRMFTSRAEHRLLLRADNAADRLTGVAEQWGLLGTTDLGRARSVLLRRRQHDLREINAAIDRTSYDGKPLRGILRRPEFTADDLTRVLSGAGFDAASWSASAIYTAATDGFYDAYVRKAQADVARGADLERRSIPPSIDYRVLKDLRTEARVALDRFKPATIGQAARLEGLTPADVTLLAVLVKRYRLAMAGAGSPSESGGELD